MLELTAWVGVTLRSVTKSFARTCHAGAKTLLTGNNHAVMIFRNVLTLKLYKFIFFTYFFDG